MAIIIETDIPAEPIAEEPIDFSGGIPQSPLVPQETLQEGFGISRNPWEIQQENADAEKLQWFSKEQADVDSAALDPDSYFKDQDISFAGEQKYAQKIVTNDLFLRLQADGGPVPTRGPERELFRSSVAQRLWNGVGAESEEAFHGQVVKDATQRKERKTISDDIYQRATRGALVGAAEPDKEQADTWQAFRDEVRNKPGYKPEDEPDLYVEWADTQYSAKQSASKFAPQLAEVWSAMKEGGGTPSEIGKATLLDVFTRPMGAPDEYASSLGQEMEKTNATKKAFEIYSQLPDDQRTEFMDALGTLARTLPKEQQASILGGMAKEGGRMVDDYGRGIASRFSVPSLQEEINRQFADSQGPLGASEEVKAESGIAADRLKDSRLDAKSFVSDVRRIEREDFSPTKYYSSASEDVFSWRTAEKGLYGIPGVVTAVGVSVLPVAGPAATYLAMEEFAFDDLRDNGMKAGMSAKDATVFADEWKSVAAIPQTGLEMLQNFGMVGRLPMVNKALTAIGDRIKAVPLRLAAKTLAANSAETVVEELQFETNYVVQDIASAFSSDTNTPPAVWYNGKDGAFDGFWNRQATTFISMLPLAGFAGAGGIDAEARARTFAEATPTQRAAYGIRPEDNAAIDAAKAKGQSSLNSAIDIAMQNRQPMADEAKAATEELAAELAEKELSTKQAQIAGTVPQFVQTDQGFSVRDQDGNEIGTSPDSAGALKIAAANSALVDEDNADQVAFLGSLLESSSATREEGETKVVDPFSKVSPTQQAAISQADEARTLQQLQSNEALGRDKFSDIVLGTNTTEVKQGVRESVTRLNAGASVLTVVHEDAHTKYRKALAAGRLTQDETAQSLKAFDLVNEGRTTKDGTPLRFLPENFDSLPPEQQSAAVEEGVSEFVEANTLRTRKNGTEIGNLTTQNITAASKLAPGAVKKFTAFAGAVRDFFGLVFARTAALKQGIREGKIKESDIDAFTSKLMGLGEQDDYNAAADSQTLEILGSEAETANALGPAALADAVITNAKKGVNNPKLKQQVLDRMMASLSKVEATIAARGTAYNFDAFGKPYAGEANFSEEKKEILNALAIMDGIVGALPKDLRGQVGGYTQLAKLDTDENRLEYLKRKVAKVKTVAEDYARKEYGRLFDKLLEKGKAKRESGQKAKGKIGAPAHRFFDQAEEARGMTTAQVDAEMLLLDDELSNSPDPEDAARIAERYQILLAFGDFKSKTAQEMASSVELLNKVYDSGRNAWRTTEEGRLEAQKIIADRAIKDLGGSSTARLQSSKAEAGKLLSKIKSGGWGILSFAEVLEGMFGRDSEIASRWSKIVRKGFTARTKGILNAAARWKDATHKATGKTGRAARQQVYDMAQKQTVKASVTPEVSTTVKVPIDTFFDAEVQTSLGLTKQEIADLTAQFEALPDKSRKEYLTLERVAAGESQPTQFTEAQAIFLSMLWSQEGYKAGMTKHGMGESFQSQLEDGMSDAAKSLRTYLAKEYADNYEPMARLFESMFGVELKKSDNYTPGKFFSQGQENTMDPTGGGLVEGGFKQGFLKDRKKHTAEARAENAFAVYFAHVNQTEHWKALAEISREIHGVLGKPEVKKAMEAKSKEGAVAMQDFLKAIDGNGFNNPKANWLLEAVMTSQAYLALAWKASTITKNLIGAGLNASYRMPTGAFLKGYSRLLSGQIDFKTVWDSDTIQNRIKGGFAPEVRSAISDAFGSEPTLRGDFLRKGMEVIGTADAFGTAAGAAITYDYHYRTSRKAGMSDQDAKRVALEETAETVGRTAQPVEVIDRSLMEMRLSGIGKLAYVFASEARQKTALWGTAWANTLTGKATKADLRVLVISHLIMAPIMHAITMMFRDLRDDDDDEWFDDKYWNPLDFGKAALTGPLAGLPLIRDIIDGYSGDSGPLKRIVDSGASLIDLFTEEPKGDEIEWYERKVTKVLQGLGPAPAVGASVFDQIFDFVRNAMD